jgi:hypothetical protein
MDRSRRERIRQLIQTLKAIQSQVHDIWIEEGGKFEDRSPPSKGTASGHTSIEAAFDLGEATDHIQIAIDHMQEAVGYGD